MTDRKIALLFPGQGSQFVGMGKALYEKYPVAKDVFSEVDNALGYELSKIIFDGPEDELNQTINTQPAIMASSIAAFKVLESIYKEKTGGDLLSQIELAAGHSLGEYSAHAACGTFSLSNTAKLLRARGNAMQEAVPIGKGGMVALIGCDIEKAKEVCKNATEYGLCQVANANGAGQIVISGAIEAMQYVVASYRIFGLRKAVMLSVSAPFHSAWMQRAADAMEKELNSVDISKPKIPIIANVSVEPVLEEDKIISALVFQVAGKVRWRETLEYMIASGINTFVEVGPSKVLSNIISRIDKSLLAYNIMEPDSFESFINRCFDA